MASGFFTLAAVLASASAAAAATCDTSALDTSSYLYPITVENTTVADVATATNRGLCNLARYNFMADVSIIPNVGQEFAIPPEVCPDEIDNTSCVLDNGNSTNTCLVGGPRLYYTVTGDTYRKIANRLDLAVSAVGFGDADEVLTPGQFVKVPLCSPSTCSIMPYQFSIDQQLVYKDLAEQYGATVGQLMMLSPTYNYSQSHNKTTQVPPTIVLPYNCTVTSDNVTVIT
ncbi:unnamed protein product [Discula destructiva]